MFVIEKKKHCNTNHELVNQHSKEPINSHFQSFFFLNLSFPKFIYKSLLMFVIEKKKHCTTFYTCLFVVISKIGLYQNFNQLVDMQETTNGIEI